MNMIKAVFDWGDGRKVPCFIIAVTDKGQCIAYREDNGQPVIEGASYFTIIEPAKQYAGEKV